MNFPTNANVFNGPSTGLQQYFKDTVASLASLARQPIGSWDPVYAQTKSLLSHPDCQLLHHLFEMGLTDHVHVLKAMGIPEQDATDYVILVEEISTADSRKLNERYTVGDKLTLITTILEDSKPKIMPSKVDLQVSMTNLYNDDLFKILLSWLVNKFTTEEILAAATIPAAILQTNDQFHQRF